MNRNEEMIVLPPEDTPSRTYNGQTWRVGSQKLHVGKYQPSVYRSIGLKQDFSVVTEMTTDQALGYFQFIPECVSASFFMDTPQKLFQVYASLSESKDHHRLLCYKQIPKGESESYKQDIGYLAFFYFDDRGRILSQAREPYAERSQVWTRFQPGLHGPEEGTPRGMIQNQILLVRPEYGIVVDPICISPKVLQSCEEMGRCGWGFQEEPTIADAVLSALETYLDKKAVRV